jgi:hypothetical protein
MIKVYFGTSITTSYACQIATAASSTDAVNIPNGSMRLVCLQLIANQHSLSSNAIVSKLMAELAASQAARVQAQLQLQHCRSENSYGKTGDRNKKSDIPMDLASDSAAQVLQQPSSMYHSYFLGWLSYLRRRLLPDKSYHLHKDFYCYGLREKEKGYRLGLRTCICKLLQLIVCQLGGFELKTVLVYFTALASSQAVSDLQMHWKADNAK